MQLESTFQGERALKNSNCKEYQRNESWGNCLRGTVARFTHPRMRVSVLRLLVPARKLHAPKDKAKRRTPTMLRWFSVTTRGCESARFLFILSFLSSSFKKLRYSFYHVIHSFKVYNWVVFSTFTESCHHHHCLSRTFHPLKGNPRPSPEQELASPCTECQPLDGDILSVNLLHCLVLSPARRGRPEPWGLAHRGLCAGTRQSCVAPSRWCVWKANVL